MQEGNVMKIGYARASLKDKTLTSQIEALKKAGCDEIIEDRNDGDHKELQKALNSVKSGDTFIVSRLISCAQNVKDLHSIIEELNTKGVSFKTIEQDLDTSTPTGKIIVGLLSTISEFERDLRAERQAIGIKSAQKKGVKFGREAIFDDLRTAEAIKLQKKGLINQEIADKFGIARSTLLRYIAKYKKTLDWEENPPTEKKKRHYAGRKNYPLKVTVHKKSKGITSYNMNPDTNSIHFDKVTLQFGTDKNNWFYNSINETFVNPITNHEFLEEILEILVVSSPPNKYEIEGMLISYFDVLYPYLDTRVSSYAAEYKAYEKENKHLNDAQEDIDTSSFNYADPFNTIADTYGNGVIPNLTKVEVPTEENSTENKDEFDIYEELGFEKPNQD